MLLIHLQGVRTIVNVFVVLNSLGTNRSHKRIGVYAKHLEKVLLELNIPTQYYKMWSEIIINYLILGTAFSLVTLAFYEECLSYIFWECVNVYFTMGVTYISISNIKSPLLNLSRALDHIKTALLRITDQSTQQLKNISKIDAFLIVSKTHTLLFESMEHILDTVSKFIIFFFCFNAIEILIIIMTYQKQIVSRSFLAMAVFDFGMICYVISTSAEIRKKVRWLNWINIFLKYRKNVHLNYFFIFLSWSITC